MKYVKYTKGISSTEIRTRLNKNEDSEGYAVDDWGRRVGSYL